MSTPQLENIAQTLVLLRADIIRREERMTQAFNFRMQALEQRLDHVGREVERLVGDAGRQIAHDAQQATAPALAGYQNTLSATASRLADANKVVLLWLGTAVVVLITCILLAWGVLGYYRDKLADTRTELQRYENALKVVEAFQRSDAVLCDERLCIHADPRAPRRGDKKQYQQARPRDAAR